MSDEVAISDAAFEVADEIVLGNLGVGNAAAVIAKALTAARDQGYNEGIEAAARYIQDQYPHDKRVLVPAIRKLERPQG